VWLSLPQLFLSCAYMLLRDTHDLLLLSDGLKIILRILISIKWSNRLYLGTKIMR
jgi:hypothetical protein